MLFITCFGALLGGAGVLCPQSGFQNLSFQALRKKLCCCQYFTIIFSLFFVVVAVSTHLLSFSPFLLSCVAVGETDSYFFVCAGLLS